MITAPSDVRVAGPLVPFAEGFCAQLAAQGYTPLSAANHVRVLAHLSRWLAAERLDVGELTPQRVEAFLQARRAQGCTCWLSVRGLAPLLDCLRKAGAAPQPLPPVPDGPVEQLLAAYRDYLRRERGLAASTAHAYEDVARLLLSQQPHPVDVEALSARDVVEFVLHECPQRSVGSAKHVVTALRCLPRFLHVEGWTGQQLADAVPAVAGWRASGCAQGAGAWAGGGAVGQLRPGQRDGPARLRDPCAAGPSGPARRRGGRPASGRRRLAGRGACGRGQGAAVRAVAPAGRCRSGAGGRPARRPSPRRVSRAVRACACSPCRDQRRWRQGDCPRRL